MKALLVRLLGVIGCWCCTKAITIAGHGFIEFEAYGEPTFLQRRLGR